MTLKSPALHKAIIINLFEKVCWGILKPVLSTGWQKAKILNVSTRLSLYPQKKKKKKLNERKKKKQFRPDNRLIPFSLWQSAKPKSSRGRTIYQIELTFQLFLENCN